MTNWSDVTFTPLVPAPDAKHHEAAAAGNTAVTAAAQRELLAALNSPPGAAGRVSHLLLKAAAGAGKSHALKRLIAAAAGAPGSRRVGVTAFTNNQIRPLALSLAARLGRDRVCLHLSKKTADALPSGVTTEVTVSTDRKSVV